jgi:hypothetical protein
MVVIICDTVTLHDIFFFLHLVFHFLGGELCPRMFHKFITHTKIFERHKKSPNPQYIGFGPYVTLTYLWWSINQRHEIHIKPYLQKSGHKNQLSLIEYWRSLHGYAHSPSLLNALDLSSTWFWMFIFIMLMVCFIVAYNLQTIAHPKSSNFLDLLVIN